jgi:hypothetical protein
MLVKIEPSWVVLCRIMLGAKRTSFDNKWIKVEPHCMVLCKIMQGAKRQAQKDVHQSRTMLCDFV